jgi:tetratricopeptide (TPR) repeat protein
MKRKASILVGAVFVGGCLCTFAQAGEPAPALKPPELAFSPETAPVPDWVARWELARVLSYARKFDESAAEYRKVLVVKPGLADARQELAFVLHGSGKAAEALSELERVPAGKLGNPSQLLLSELLMTQKRYADADRHLREYLRRNPQDLKARLRRAELLSWTKDYPASLKEYETVLAARPDDVQVRRKYALVLSWTGRHSDAARELKRTLP